MRKYFYLATLEILPSTISSSLREAEMEEEYWEGYNNKGVQLQLLKYGTVLYSTVQLWVREEMEIEKINTL